MSLEQVVSDQNELLKKQNATIASLSEALNSNAERLRRATAECNEQHMGRISAETELSSRRFVHWVVHVLTAMLVAWLLTVVVSR